MKRLPAIFFLALCGTASAIEPAEVFLLVNKNEKESWEVAEHYCKQRKVPTANIIELDVSIKDDVSREDYDAKIAGPVREALKDRKDKAKVLLSIYGMPLRVGASKPDAAAQAEIDKMDKEIGEIGTLMNPLFKKKAEIPETRKEDREKLDKQLKELDDKANALRVRQHALRKPESVACVDSELMLLWWPKYDLNRFVFNPLHWQRSKENSESTPQVVMTCRLDGPTAAIARGLVDKAMEAEKSGLKGKVYVDARGIKDVPKGDPGWGLQGYDESMREMAALLKDSGKMEVVLDDKDEWFKPNACKDCALYCGWYALRNFQDSFEFVPGAIAWHLASFEATSLHAESKEWCRNLLAKGAAATLGPVAEPYTVGFPKPEEFFGFLATGKYNLVEAYSRTSLMTSWMTVLVGDPLYTPFKANPKVKEEDVKPSPKWGKFITSEKG